MKKITFFTLILFGISMPVQASLDFLTQEEQKALQKEIEQQKRSFDLDEDEDEMDQDIDPEQKRILNVLTGGRFFQPTRTIKRRP